MTNHHDMAIGVDLIEDFITNAICTIYFYKAIFTMYMFDNDILINASNIILTTTYTVVVNDIKYILIN